MTDEATKPTPDSGRIPVALTSVTDEDGAKKTPQQVYDELMVQLTQSEHEESAG